MVELYITSHQCGRWLRTEYDTAVIRAHQAADWQQFLDEADVLPNLEWMPSTSANPGADHQVFWGTILPISDPFWNEHRPGDRWNCKCSLQATDKRPTGRPTSASPVNTDPQPGLESNPGTDGVLFAKSHPYFPKSCSDCPFNDGKTSTQFKNKENDCIHCQALQLCINRTVESPKGYVEDKIFGGRFLISKCADDKDLVPNIDVAHVLLSNFSDIQMTIRSSIDSELGEKNPEYTINGHIADRKGIEKEDGIANAFKKAKEQGCSIVVIDLDTQFIRKRVKYDKLGSKIYHRHADFESGEILECYVVRGNKAVVIKETKSLDEVKAILKIMES